MEIKQNHLIALVVLAALAIAYFAQRNENTRRADRDRATVITLCKKTVARDAYEAAGFNVLSQRVGKRANAGDRRSAAQYEAVAAGIARKLPAPKGLTDPERLLEVDLVEQSDGRLRYELTAAASALQAKGCEEAV